MASEDIEKPMGNAELRLTLASIESEVVETKGIAIETREQAKKTNGRVNWHDKMLWLSMGALPLLTIWAGWLTNQVLQQPGVETAQLQAAVASGIQDALNTYTKNK